MPHLISSVDEKRADAFQRKKLVLHEGVIISLAISTKVFYRL